MNPPSSPFAPPLQPLRRTLTTHDADVYATGQDGWHLECEVLSGGRFAGFFDHVQLPGLRLVHETTNRALRQHGEMSPQCCGFAFAYRQDGEARFSGQRLDAGSVMVGRGDELDLCSPPGFELRGLAVDNALLEAAVQRMHGRPQPAWLARRVVLHVSPEQMRALHQTMLDALGAVDANPGLLDDPVAAAQLRDDVLLAWLSVLPEEVDLRQLKSTEARRRVVRRACEAMMARPDEPLSMLEVCSRIGASQRKLNYCFQETLGLSPARYLRALRLNGVHRELKRPRRGAACVQDIAAHWGFWHLGQFATDYRRQFGELPSQTLQAAGPRA